MALSQGTNLTAVTVVAATVVAAATAMAHVTAMLNLKTGNISVQQYSYDRVHLSLPQPHHYTLALHCFPHHTLSHHTTTITACA